MTDVAAPQTRGPHIPGLPERYRVGERVAETATSDVYLATDAVLEREVAVKVLRSFVGAASGRCLWRATA